MPPLPRVTPPEISAPARTRAHEPLRRQKTLPAPPSGFRRRVVHFLLVFVTVVLVVDALIGEKGLMETIRATRQAREQAVALDRLRSENARLREVARRLREDPSAIEAVARQELGLIRPGEVLFILKDVKPAANVR